MHRYLYPLETQDKGKAKSKDSPVRGSRRRTANPVPPAAPPTPPDATPTPPTVTQESDEERGGKAAGRPTKQTSKDSSKRKRLESKSDGSDQESSQVSFSCTAINRYHGTHHPPTRLIASARRLRLERKEHPNPTVFCP